MNKATPEQDFVYHQGSCHCGAVRFEFKNLAKLHVLICNCSICRLTKFEHIIVPKEDFKLITGQAALSEYRFGTQAANHTFCKTCGVKAFYSPRSHPAAYSVNLHCVEKQSIEATTIEYFDGKNWEQAHKGLQR